MTATAETRDRTLPSHGMLSVLVAQFFSALADNAALIIAITLVRSSGTDHRVPVLQEAFAVPFILLAAFAGPVSDGFPKGRVMLLANLQKLTGAILMAAWMKSNCRAVCIGVW